jgi:hypothetical protein
MATVTCLAPDGSLVYLTGVRFFGGKYAKYMDLARGVLEVKCSMQAKSGNGKPCRYYAHGCLDGTPVCSGHFPKFAPVQKMLSTRELMLTKVVQLKECTEVECPVCMEDFIATESSMCGHTVCSSCCHQMKATGRTLMCPMCRDPRFKSLVELNAFVPLKSGGSTTRM